MHINISLSLTTERVYLLNKRVTVVENLHDEVDIVKPHNICKFS